LEAVSLLGKAGEVSKPIAIAVQDLIESGLKLALPPIGSWGNAEDRYYFAKGISVSRANWVKDYAAAELARAEISESVFEKCVCHGQRLISVAVAAMMMRVSATAVSCS
jgi:hypothetical protein